MAVYRFDVRFAVEEHADVRSAKLGAASLPDNVGNALGRAGSGPDTPGHVGARCHSIVIFGEGVCGECPRNWHVRA